MLKTGVDSTKVRRSYALRGLLALVVMMALAVSTVAPAYAGSLTAASFTASTPYTYTSAQNARYDYGFTTATTSTLSKVTMSVPAGTGGSNRYLALGGSSNNDVSTPDSVANSISGDLDIRAKIQLNTYALTEEPIFRKWPASDQGFLLSVSNGNFYFCTSGDGTNGYCESNMAIPVAAGAAVWLRATEQPNTPAGHHTSTVYTSLDGVTWSTPGSVVSNGSFTIHDSSAPLTIGGPFSTAGKIYYADVRSGINGTIVNRFDPNDATATQAAAGSWTSSSPQAEPWTVNQSGTNLPADIATDLNVSNVSGLPTGGTANYRFYDGVATYNFTPTSVPSGTPCTVSLQGFTNTATPGSYSSTLTTYDNSGPPPVAVDSVTTSALLFVADSSNTSASVTIDPSMTFTVAGRGSACNGQSATNFQTGATASAVSLGHLSQSTVGGGAQDLSVASNAGGGVTVYLRTSGITPNAMRDTNAHSIADVTGTNASPGSAPIVGTAGFGYTSNDASTPFTSNTWAKLTNANDPVLIAAAGTYSKAACVGYEIAVAPSTPASSYSATMIYTAVPVY